MEQDTRAGAHSAGDGARSPGPPIYDDLVGEQGDVPSEARHAAEHTQRTAGEVLDFHRPQPPTELADGDTPQGPAAGPAPDGTGGAPPGQPAAPRPAPSRPEGAPKPSG